jgi:hypothetical protein
LLRLLTAAIGALLTKSNAARDAGSSYRERARPRCIGTFITNARYWTGPVSGDLPGSPVSSIRSTKPCSPQSGAFRRNHYGQSRFPYRFLRFAPLWVGAGRGGPGCTTSPGPSLNRC